MNLRIINYALFLLAFFSTISEIKSQQVSQFDPDDIEIEITAPSSSLEYHSSDLISVELTIQGDRPIPEKICIMLTNMDEVKDKLIFFDLPKNKSLPYTFKTSIPCPPNEGDEPKDIELRVTLYDGEIALTSSDVDITIMNKTK